MTRTSARMLIWLPRILGIGIALFFSLFTLDAFGGREPVLDVTMHLLPAATILLVVAIAWRYPVVGAVTFTALGVAYALMVRRADWVAVISTPLLLVGAAFLASALLASGKRVTGNG